MSEQPISAKLMQLCQQAAEAKGESLEAFLQNALWEGLEDACFHTDDVSGKALEKAMAAYED